MTNKSDSIFNKNEMTRSSPKQQSINGWCHHQQQSLFRTCVRLSLVEGVERIEKSSNGLNRLETQKLNQMLIRKDRWPQLEVESSASERENNQLLNLDKNSTDSSEQMSASKTFWVLKF